VCLINDDPLQRAHLSFSAADLGDVADFHAAKLAFSREEHRLADTVAPQAFLVLVEPFAL